MLSVRGVNQYYGGSHILRDVSFDVPTGCCTALLGRNGVGKTTLLKCLMGLLPVASGQILFAGHDLTSLTPHQRARLGLGYVPQGREIFARLTVEENLKMGLAAKTGLAAKKIPGEIYEMFPVLKQMSHRRGGDLSGGQQQQLAIARALLTQPRLLILDEPTEGIQPSIIKEIERLIARLAKQGEMSILLVEQYYEFAKGLADEYMVMSRGGLVMKGLATEMESTDVRRYLAL
jgi:urea transport system ATP-binding protein